MTAPRDAATSHGNVTTFHFHNGIRLIVPTEADGPEPPEYVVEAAQEIAQATLEDVRAWADADLTIEGPTA